MQGQSLFPCYVPSVLPCKAIFSRFPCARALLSPINYIANGLKETIYRQDRLGHIFRAFVRARAALGLVWHWHMEHRNMNFFALTWYIILPVHSIRILHILTHTPVL